MILTKSKIIMEVLIMNIGIIGCGNISPIYFQAGEKFDSMNIVACADLNLEAAKKRAEEFNIPKACTVDEILEDH